jgi:hypothetical protein
MKTFLGAKKRTLDRNSAMALAGLNLLATPGLGTIFAGRIFVGALQLGAAGAGFLLIMKWFYSLFMTLLNGSGSAPSWEWESGLMLFFIGWIGSAWSSLNFVRAASSSAETRPNLQTPPKLDGSPG